MPQSVRRFSRGRHVFFANDSGSREPENNKNEKKIEARAVHAAHFFFYLRLPSLRARKCGAIKLSLFYESPRSACALVAEEIKKAPGLRWQNEKKERGVEGEEREREGRREPAKQVIVILRHLRALSM